MRVFVAGATGVLGRRAVAALLERGHHVTGAARSAANVELLTRLGATPATVDVFDAAAVKAAVQGHDAVCNLATNIPRLARAALPNAWATNDRLRREAAGHLAAAARATGAAVLVQESITFTYEDGADRWLDEEAPVRAHHNLASALDAEATARSFGTDAGVGIVLRFAAFYGPDSHHTRDQLAMARRGLPVTAGEEQGFVSSIHTDDASAAVALAVEAASRGALPSGVYNVGDDEPLARRAVADALAGAAGKAHGRVGGRAFRLAGGAKLEPLTRSQRVSNRRFKDAAAWTPAWSSFVQGLSALSPMLSAPRTPR